MHLRGASPVQIVQTLRIAVFSSDPSTLEREQKGEGRGLCMVACYCFLSFRPGGGSQLSCGYQSGIFMG